MSYISLPQWICEVFLCGPRESSARQHHSVYEAARDSSEDEAYWQSMGSVICEDQLKLWDTAENKLRQYQWVTTSHTHTHTHAHTHTRTRTHTQQASIWTLTCCFCVGRAVLAEISALVPETESLQQQNRELRILLQQTLKVMFYYPDIQLVLLLR